jgi:DNA-binding helix-hairpin-helix protein with protein kinase domain
MPKTLTSSSGRKYKILKPVAQGAQGRVYKAECVATGDVVALKLVNVAQGSSRPEVVRRLSAIRDAADDLPPIFVLPTDILADGQVGYVMEFISDYTPLESVLAARDVAQSLRDFTYAKRLRACYRLASGFKELHTRGMYYADISWANVLVNCKTGEAKIIDNDNLDPTGRAAATIIGTPWFIAPELISKAKRNPDAFTDYHSLATLLYYILVIDHPLIGDRVAAAPQEQEEELLSKNAVFTQHPTDRTNSSQFGGLYGRLPSSLRQLFEQAFTKGLTQPTERVANGKWMSCLMQVIDELSECNNCGAKNFYPEDGTMYRCISCGRKMVQRPLLLEFRHPGRSVRKAVLRGARILAHHWRQNSEFDIGKDGIGAVIWFQEGTGYVLQNTLQQQIYASYGDLNYAIDPGKYIALTPGMQLRFGHNGVPATVVRP